MLAASGHVLLNGAARTPAIYLLRPDRRASQRPAGRRADDALRPHLAAASKQLQNAITGPDTSLVGGMVAATVLLVTNYLVPDLSGANRRFREFIQGQPSMLMHVGQVIESHMAREHVSIAASDARTRDRGLSRGRDRVLEVDSAAFWKYDDIHPTANPHLVPARGNSEEAIMHAWAC